MNEPMESRGAELAGLLASAETPAVAPVADATKKRRLSIGAAKYLRRDKEPFMFVWHLKKWNLED